MNLDQYIREFTLLGNSHLSYFALFAASMVFTLAHSYQERSGRLWSYFGNIAGIEISDRTGILLFFWGLTLSLWAVALAAYFGVLITTAWGVTAAIGAVGFLIGARLSDSWYSHLRLHRMGYKPNPGLGTVPLYLVESAVLFVVFLPGLVKAPIAAASGLALGWLGFFSVLPVLRWLGRRVKPT